MARAMNFTQGRSPQSALPLLSASTPMTICRPEPAAKGRQRRPRSRRRFKAFGYEVIEAVNADRRGLQRELAAIG
jgi:hypothetical protein